MPPAPTPARSLAARRRIVWATLLLAAALMVAGVVLAVAADPSGAADRIRPVSEAVDAAFAPIRGASRAALVAGAVAVSVLYALAAVYLGNLRQRRRRRGKNGTRVEGEGPPEAPPEGRSEPGPEPGPGPGPGPPA